MINTIPYDRAMREFVEIVYSNQPSKATVVVLDGAVFARLCATLKEAPAGNANPACREFVACCRELQEKAKKTKNVTLDKTFLVLQIEKMCWLYRTVRIEIANAKPTVKMTDE